jgi:LPXTG-site transpeptidase (sortase) family protein
MSDRRPDLSRVLLWAERTLLVVGMSLGVWSLTAALQMRYYAQLPVPQVSAARTLPGDSGSARHAAAPRGEWVARLEVPAVGLSATVLEGSDDRTLARGAGRIEETALPGESGNVGIAGHRDTTFRPLRRVAVGDSVRLTTIDRIYEYRVTSTTIVGPQDVHVLDPTKHPTLTLVTCYPFTYIGNAPKRFIVKAELVDSRGQAGLAGRVGPAGRAQQAGQARQGF